MTVKRISCSTLSCRQTATVALDEGHPMLPIGWVGDANRQVGDEQFCTYQCKTEGVTNDRILK